MSNQNNKLLVDMVIEGILARLKERELEEANMPSGVASNLHVNKNGGVSNRNTVQAMNFDPYTKGVLQKLGRRPKTSMTKEQLDALFNSVFNNASLQHKTKWVTFFYGGMLSKRVFLSSFLKYSTNESKFYSNYKYQILNEASNVHITPAEIEGTKVIYIKTPLESSAYIQSKRDPSLYITSNTSGEYRSFLQIGTNALFSEERKKLLQFVPQASQQILQQANAKITSEYSQNQELQRASAALLTGHIPPIIMDTIALAFADVLNINLQPNYGNQKAAAGALAASPLLSNAQQYGNKVLGITPEIAQNLQNKLQEIITLENPYILNLEILRQAKKSIRNKNTFYTGFANNLFSTWANLLSYIGRLYGNNVDLNLFIVNQNGTLKTKEEKKQALLEAVSGSGTNKVSYATGKGVPNSFFKIIGVNRNTTSSKAYILDATNIGGFKYKENELDWINPDSPKVMAVPIEVMARAKELAIESNANTVNGIFYSLAKMTKASMSQQNANMGATINPQEQLLDVLKAVYDPQDNYFTDTTLFASVPYILLQCAGKKLDIVSTDSPIPITDDMNPFAMSSEKTNAGETRIMLAMSGYGGANGKPDSELYSKYNFRPIADICNEYLDFLLKDKGKSDITGILVPKFIQLIHNLERGMWTNNAIKVAGFGGQTIAGFNPMVLENGTIRMAESKLTNADEIKRGINLRLSSANK